MAKIVVVGDVMLDIQVEARERSNYEDMDYCLTGTEFQYYPGGAANVAALLAAQGHSVQLYGLVGDDHYATILRELLAGIGVDYLLAPAMPCTSVKLRTYSDGIRIRIDCENLRANGSVVGAALADSLDDTPDCLVLSDYAKGVFGVASPERVKALIKAAPVSIVDPHPHNCLWMWEGVTVATPNSREWRLIRDGGGIDTQYLVITAGANGANVLSQLDQTLHHIQPKGVVLDAQVVGAGDAFTAGLAAVLAEHELTSPILIGDLLGAVQVGVNFATDYVARPRHEVCYERPIEGPASQAEPQ